MDLADERFEFRQQQREGIQRLPDAPPWMDDAAAGLDPALSMAVERHLLVALLNRSQRRTMAAAGWFDLLWPEQYLVLRVHTRRFPTVDGYQAVRNSPAARCGIGEGLVVSSATTGWTATARLCSWDTRHTLQSLHGRLAFSSCTATPLGQATANCQQLAPKCFVRSFGASRFTQMSVANASDRLCVIRPC